MTAKPKARKKPRTPAYLKTIYEAACDWHWYKTTWKKETPEMKKLFRALSKFERAEARKP